MKEIKRGIDRRRIEEQMVWPLMLDSGESVHQERRGPRNRRKNGFISGQAFFEDIPYSTLEPIISQCETVSLQAGEVLLELNRDNHHLYLLIEGQLRVIIDSNDKENGILIDPGNFIGEVSIIDGQQTTAYVVADSDCYLLSIPEQILWGEFFRIPAIARNFMRMSAARFRKLNQSFQVALEKQLRFEHLQKELGIAHDIQASMLPRRENLCESSSRVDLDAIMEPANNVAGDFYDSFPLKDGRICIAIGDVSGKGIPASLFMVKTMTLLREMVNRYGDLVKSMRKLNNKLCKDNEQCMFATLIVGIIDPQSGLLSYVNAGHNRPLLGHAGSEFEYLDSAGGILVGIKEGVEYSAQEVPLQPGQVFILYTDGITEAMNPQHEPYSDERFRARVSRCSATSATEYVSQIRDDVTSYVGIAKQSDDITMLVCQYRP